MPVLSYEDIQQVWIRNGGDPSHAKEAAAIALAESRGRTDAHNPKPPDDSYGLWQVNYFGGLRQSRTQSYGPPEGLYDANAAARAAIGISRNGTDWRAWSTAWENPKARTGYFGSSAPVWTYLSGVGPKPVTEPKAYASRETAAGTELLSPSDYDKQPVLKLPGMGTVLTISQARAITSVMCIVAGVAVAGVGIVLLAGKSVSVPNPVSAVRDLRLNREIERGEQAAPDELAQRRRYNEAKAGVRRLPTGEEAF